MDSIEESRRVGGIVQRLALNQPPHHRCDPTLRVSLVNTELFARQLATAAGERPSEGRGEPYVAFLGELIEIAGAQHG
jgi:hypothetical protein